MAELQQYLAEEVAEDHADGVITRREAMRRFGLLGVAGSTAAGMLGAAASQAAAKQGGRARAASDGGGSRAGEAEDGAPIVTQPITFPGPRGTLMRPGAA